VEREVLPPPGYRTCLTPLDRASRRLIDAGRADQCVVVRRVGLSASETHRSRPKMTGFAPLNPSYSLQDSFDVGLGEIIAHVEQGQPSALCEGIGKAVAVIQAGRMSALAEAPPSHASDLGLV
jgi:hypothetical protein